MLRVFVLFNFLFSALGLAGSFFSLVEKTMTVNQFFSISTVFMSAFLVLLSIFVAIT